MRLNIKDKMVRVLVKGGVISPSYMLKIIQTARKASNSGICFGSRQDMMFNLPMHKPDGILKELSVLKVDYLIGDVDVDNRQNIVSSYVAADILQSTQWLNSGNYLQILDQLTYPHLLRINIADPCQTMVPLFYGNLNFVASEVTHYWYLYLRLPSDYQLKRWPVLIYSTDIATISRSIEQLWLNDKTADIDSLYKQVNETGKYNNRKIDKPLNENKNINFDYEGFGRMSGSNRYWTGLFWRNNSYDINFMEEVCNLCIQTGVSKMAITPWKSFIIKDIEEKDLAKWNSLHGRYGITMRHSALELNWHLPFGNNDALQLKKHIVKKFDKKDVCVHGITFGVNNGHDLPFCTVMIKEKKAPLFLKYLPFLSSYDIDMAENFNPNSGKYLSYIKDCPRNQLTQTLANLTRIYFNQFTYGSYTEQSEEKPTKTKKIVSQCPNCQSIYLPEKGDLALNILPNTSFDDLPDHHCCPLCDTPKEQFVKVDLTLLQQT